MRYDARDRPDSCSLAYFDNLLYFTDRKVLLKAGCFVTLWEFVNTFLINIFLAQYLNNSEAVLLA